MSENSLNCFKIVICLSISACKGILSTHIWDCNHTCVWDTISIPCDHGVVRIDKFGSAFRNWGLSTTLYQALVELGTRAASLHKDRGTLMLVDKKGWRFRDAPIGLNPAKLSWQLLSKPIPLRKWEYLMYDSLYHRSLNIARREDN